MARSAFTSWPEVLSTLTAGENLGIAAAEGLMGEILEGEAAPTQIAAAVAALATKGETVDELTGFVRAMQDHATPLQLPDDCIDIVGVGGGPARRRGALNVSTMASVVAAAAGAVVCKHGNRRASSTSGSFDLLEALGVGIDLTPERLEECVAEVGLGFAFARSHHPAMRFAGPVRAELGIATVFNLIGPLSHPGRLTRQVVGVADPTRAESMAQVLQANGTRRAWVVSGHGPLDELATTGPSQVIATNGSQVERFVVDPTDVGISVPSRDALVGGDEQANAVIAHLVFGGAEGAPRDIVVLNAAAGLVVAGRCADLRAGVDLAAEAIDSGAAAAKLAELVRFTATG